MRYLFGFICVLALGVMPLVGCSETSGEGGSGGDGGSGGTAGDGGSGGVAGTAKFIVDPPVTVSGESPFANCDADLDPEQAYRLGSEVQPWIAVNPANPKNIAAVWQQDWYVSGGGRGTGAAVSMDGGATWEHLVIPGLSSCSGGPWLRTNYAWLSFAQNGDLYSVSRPFDEPELGELGGAVVVSRSTDGGLSWGDPVLVDKIDGPLANTKPSITADPEDPCTAYVGWTRYHEPFPSVAATVLVSRTTDCGETWQEPQVLSDVSRRFIGVQILALPDGSLRAFSVGGEGRTMIVQQSTDKGDTWSEPTLVANLRRFAPGPFTADGTRRIFSAEYLFDVAVDRTTGSLYAVWEQMFVPAPAEFPANIAFTSSTDGGVTWSTPIRIDQTPVSASFLLNQAFLPSVEVADDGIVAVTYYNFQNAMLGSPSSLTDTWFVHCDPASVDCAEETSWSGTELRLTPRAFDFLLAPDRGENLFLGDYVGLAPSGNDFLAFFSLTTEDDPANAIFVPIRAR
jgi:hypothetical protein